MGMKPYLVIFLFIFSFLANSSGMAGMWSGIGKGLDPVQIEVQPVSQPVAMGEHCHSLKSVSAPTNSDRGMQSGGSCDNCFTHCGGALLTAEFPNFTMPPPLLVEHKAHFYTPLLNTAFFRPPQIA